VRVVIDAMCAEYGGIRTYVEHLLLGWAAAHPEDEVHVALRAGSTLATPGLTRHEYAVGRPDALSRPWIQATAMHRMIRSVAPDVVLATAPTTDVRRVDAAVAVVILDLRAEILPHQFSRGRRVLRKVSYERAYRLADGFLSISQRSLDDLHRLHPDTASKPGTVAYLGGDHARAWATTPPKRQVLPAEAASVVDRGGNECGPRDASAHTQKPAIAFAHHTNKNPQLVIDAWALLRARGVDVPPLTFLGVSGELRPGLTSSIENHGLTDEITLSKFLPDAEFQQTFADASMVVFPSDFEGFGLPVVEAQTLRKPLVIAPDAGLVEVAGGHAAVTTGWTPQALADAITSALDITDEQLDAAETWAGEFTWSRCIEVTHAALSDLVAARNSRGGQKA
jgi:glycosyltransferase involved in cell wall biosynthesis